MTNEQLQGALKEVMGNNLYTAMEPISSLSIMVRVACEVIVREEQWLYQPKEVAVIREASQRLIAPEPFKFDDA